MVFNSFAFLAFFLVIFSAYFLAPLRWRWLVLLLASYAFYASWQPGYVPLLLATTLLCYALGRGMQATDKPAWRKTMLYTGLAGLLGTLFAFKYFNFFTGLFTDLISRLGLPPVQPPQLSLLAPLGISFYTLQLVSYLVDVSRGSVPAEKHFGTFALYVSFFPQIIAGPIPRAKQLMGQLRQPAAYDERRVTHGLLLFLWGLLQKMVFADRLSGLVGQVYADPEIFGGADFAFATVLFAFQVLADFAGYSAMALGAARVFGIELVNNFNHPYTAKSPAEFWERWHISLSTWLRDYIFYPLSRWLRRLGAGREALVSLLLPPLVTMLVSGLWHGVGLQFLVWGGLHGLLLALTDLLRRSPLRLPQGKWRTAVDWLRQAATFAAVTFLWIFFRASDHHVASSIIRRLFTPGFVLLQEQQVGVAIATILLALYLLLNWLSRKGYGAAWLMARPGWLRWCLYTLAIIFLLYAGKFTSEDFIYAQF